MPSPRDQTLDINGIQPRLYSSAQDARPGVWLLHGFPECWVFLAPSDHRLSDARLSEFMPRKCEG